MIGAVVYNLIELINYYFTYRILMNIKFTGKRVPYILVVGISCAMQMVVYWQEGFVWGYVINIGFISGFIGAFVLTQSKKRKVMLLYPIAFFICSLINTVGSWGLAMIIGISQYEISLSVPFTCLSECTGIIVLFAYDKIRARKKRDEINFTIGQYILLCIGILCLAVLLSFAQELFVNGKEYWEPVKELAMCAVVLLAICFVVLSIDLQRTWRKNFQYKAEREKYELFLAQQENHIRMLITEDEKRRKLRHDMNAHMLAMDSMITRKEWEELHQYFGEMQNSLGERNVDSYTNISAVDAVIAEWHQKAKEKQISWEWDGTIVRKEQITVFELCTIFSNLLSNAVEATDLVEEKKDIQVSTANFQEQLVITVRNTCISQLSTKTKPISSKKDKVFHGLGLRNVEEIVEKHKGDIKYTVLDGWFQVDIII